MIGPHKLAVRTDAVLQQGGRRGQVKGLLVIAEGMGSCLHCIWRGRDT